MASAAPSGTQEFLGRTLGDFVVLEKLGEGGFGAVYRAEQRLLRRDAVIKVLRRSHGSDEGIIQRFLREAQLASALDHPYAAHIYSFGAEPDGLLWIAMERVRGTPLDQMLTQTGPLPLERFVPLFQRICEVVQSAHEHSIVHRDIKPANVMVLSRSGLLLPKLLDFGIAKHLGEGDDVAALDISSTNPALPNLPEELPNDSATIDRKLTTAGSVLGSPHYMAPEQWVNHDVGPHTDLYALGVLAYEALTGRVPFDGKDLMQIARGHAKRPVPPLGEGFAPALDAVLQRAMAKRPTERFAHALDFAAELHAASGLSAEPLGLPQLEEPVREALLSGAPQPLAEAIAAYDAVRSIHQARDAIWQIFHVAVRLLGLYAIAARSRAAVEGEDAAIELLRTLRRRGLSDREWVSLTRALVAPHARRRDTYALPDLVGLFFDTDGEPLVADPLAELAELREEIDAAATEDAVRQHLGRVAPRISAALRRLAFLGGYTLVGVRGELIERWMGVRRPRRQTLESRGAKLSDGTVALLADDLTPILILHPLVQLLQPTPGAPPEMFLFDGPGRRGARLLSLPTAFEHSDDALWDWYRTALGAGGEDGAEPGAQERAPYVGLSAFSAEDADLFFGRDRDVEVTLNRLRTATFLAIVGPSGAGKSSFVHAGVATALPPGSQVIATRPGSHPFDALAARLQRAAPHSHLGADLLAASPDALAAALATLPAPPGAWTVLVVDQFEELFTLTSDEQERTRFAEAIVRAARGAEAPVRVLLTLRDDFLMRTQEITVLREALAAGLQLLGTPSPEDLRRIVLEPARRVGYELDDPKLVDEMVAQVRNQPAALPLVSFTALRLWELRDRHFRQLTRKSYLAMGGVGGALAGHAEEMLERLGPEEQRLVREAFRHLVTAEGTRAVMSRVELAQVLAGGARAEGVIDRLVESRLVVASEAERGAAQIEIAHEALISAWPRLVTWRAEDAEGARLRDQLRAAVRQWSDRGRPRGLLWRDEALAEYELWRTRHPQPLTQAEESFARASQGQARAGKRLRRQLLVGVFAMLAIGLFVLFRSDRKSRLNAAESKARLATFHAEQARQQLLADDPLRGLVYLAEARRLGDEDDDLRVLEFAAREALSPLRLTIGGHFEEVWDAAFSGDGKRVISFSPSGVVLLSDGETGSTVMQVRDRPLSYLELSPDGSLLATRSVDQATVWEVPSGRKLYTIDHQPIPKDESTIPTRIHFSGDGRYLVTSGDDRAVHVWRAGDGAPVYTLRGHAGAILALEVAGPSAAVSTDDSGGARVWDLSKGTLLRSFGGPELGPLSCAALSADGRRLIVGGKQQARLWDARSGKQLAAFEPTFSSRGAAVSSDGKVAAILGELDTFVQLWDEAGHPGGRVTTHSALLSIAFSPDGTRLVGAGIDGAARVWDTHDAHEIVSLHGHVGRVWHARFSADGTRVVSAGVDRTVRTWVPEPPGLEVTLRHPVGVIDARESANGQRLFTSSEDRVLREWDLPRAQLVTQLAPVPDREAAPFVLWTPDGKSAIAFGGQDVLVLGADGKPISPPLHHDRGASWATTDREHRRLAVGLVDGRIVLWRLPEGRRERVLEGHTQEIAHLSFDDAGRHLGSASYDETARVWTLDAETPPLVLRGHVSRVESIVFSPDDKSVLTGGVDQTLRIWDVHTGSQLRQLTGHTSEILMARYSHDGRLIASAATDGVRVWGAASGKQLLMHPGTAYAATFSEDDRHLVIAATNGLVTRWRVSGADDERNSTLANFMRCRVPYRLSGDSLLPTPLAADCTK